jgi:hypothetical protein
MNSKLGKLRADPKYTYKGMVYADGIKDKQLSIYPKVTDEGTNNAKCQFKKCLFRVEVRAEYKYACQDRDI